MSALKVSIPWNKGIDNRTEHICEYCGDKYLFYNNSIKSKYCNRKCWKKSIIGKSTKWLKGLKRSEETKRKISETMKQQYKSGVRIPFFTEEHKNKLRKYRIGKPSPMKNRHHKDEVKKRMSEHWNYNKHFTPEIREKLRQKRFNYVKQLENLRGPNMGKYEKELLDILENAFKTKILRQYYCKGYFIDGYIPEAKIAIEIDEQHHKHNNVKDIERENIIKQELNCNFIRIPSPS